MCAQSSTRRAVKRDDVPLSSYKRSLESSYVLERRRLLVACAAAPPSGRASVYYAMVVTTTAVRGYRRVSA